jgi:hypothetical protein
MSISIGVVSFIKMSSVNIFNIFNIQFFFFVSATDARLQPPEIRRNQKGDGLIDPFCVYDCPVPDQKRQILEQVDKKRQLSNS